MQKTRAESVRDSIGDRTAKNDETINIKQGAVSIKETFKRFVHSIALDLIERPGDKSTMLHVSFKDFNEAEFVMNCVQDAEAIWAILYRISNP
jgi:hypothetical protein